MSMYHNRPTVADMRAMKTRGQKISITYRNFAAEYARLQQERIAAFQEFIADVQTGAYPQPAPVVSIKDEEFEGFLAQVA